MCEHDCPESQRAPKRTWMSMNKYSGIVPGRSHDRCKHSLNDKYRAEHNLHHKSMTLDIMQACRQAYNEANQVLWSTNTFSFCDAATLDQFMVARRLYQKRTLRKLRLEMDWSWELDKPWNKAIGITLVRSLPGLRSLRLQISHSMTAASYREAKARGSELGLFQTQYLGFAHRMATLPLTDVEVFVGDRYHRQSFGLDWSTKDRLEYAEGIRDILLNPKGAEIYAQDQDELKEFYRHERERAAEFQARMSKAFSHPSELAVGGAPLNPETIPTTTNSQNL